MHDNEVLKMLEDMRYEIYDLIAKKELEIKRKIKMELMEQAKLQEVK